jgi:hypothetical protein
MVWVAGDWPVSEPEVLARLVRQDSAALPPILKELGLLGWQQRGGRLLNPAIAAIRREALSAMAVRKAMGRVAARKRWHGGDHPPGMRSACGPHTDGIPCAMPTACAPNTQYSTVHNSTSHAIKTDERLTLSGSPREKTALAPETEFLSAVAEVLEQWRKGSAKAELQNWGAWWRSRFRKSPRKARAVLNDIRSLVVERRITKSPGNAAVDLWKRLP